MAQWSTVDLRGLHRLVRYSGEAFRLKIFLCRSCSLSQKFKDWSNGPNVVIEDALAFAKPEYKGFASGRCAGSADFTTLMPSQADFMQQLKVRGQVDASPIVLNSVKVGEMVNAQISKVPQLKLKPMKVDPLRGQAKMRFDLDKGVVDIASFQGVDVDNSENSDEGKSGFGFDAGDLAGTFYLNDPPSRVVRSKAMRILKDGWSCRWPSREI